MAKITIDIDSQTAEEVLFALKLRASQRNRHQESAIRMELVRQQLNAEAERVFGWAYHPDRLKADGEIRVNVTHRNRW